MFKAMRNQLRSVVIALVLGSLPVQMIFEDTTAQVLSYREQRKKEAERLLFSGRGSRGSGPRYPYSEKKFLQALAIYRELGDWQGEIKTLILLAEVNALRFRHSKAVEDLRLAIQIAQSTGVNMRELEVLTSLIEVGDIFKRRIRLHVYEYLIRRDPLSINLDERLVYLAGADNLCSNYRDTYGDIGDAYFDKKLYAQAVSAYKKGVLECHKARDEFSRENQYKNLAYMGITYKMMGQELQAETTFNEALIYYENIFRGNTRTGGIDDRREPFMRIAVAKDSTRLLRMLFRLKSKEDIGDVYELLEKYDLALYNYEQELDLRSHYEDSSRLLHKIARMHVRLGNNSDALKFFLLAHKNLLLVHKRLLGFTERNFDGGNYHNLYSYGVGLLIDMGNFYTRMGDQEKAKSFYKQADEILNESGGIGGWGGGAPSASILSDEDDLGKLLADTSKERKPETTNQVEKK